MNTAAKLRKLEGILQGLGKAVVAFSGGVDSTFLAAAAERALGDGALAITAVSASLARSERKEAAALAKRIGIRHVAFKTDELNDELFTANSAERCYHCKKIRFKALLGWAAARGYPWVLEGSNVDDDRDYRPGRRALAELRGVRSPLEEAGLTKAEIRDASRRWRLPTWKKPSAACLSSRIEYGLPQTPERLGQVEEAEEFIRKRCRGQLRVRHHGTLARIEVEPEWIPRLAQPAAARQIVRKLKQLGFHHVALDLSGYRMGSLNQDIGKK
jgi:uncharacterized protein